MKRVQLVLSVLAAVPLVWAVFNGANPLYQSYPPAYPLYPTKNQTTRVLTLGVFGWFTSPVLPDDGGAWAAGLESAVELFLSVQAAADLFNAKWVFVWVEVNIVPYQPCIQYLAAQNAVFLNRYAGFIGDTTDVVNPGTLTASAEAMMAGKFNVPYCSPLVFDDMFDDKTTYPTFFRTIGKAELAGAGVADWVVSMGWTKVVLVVSCQNNDGYGFLFFGGFVQRAAHNRIDILDTIYIYCGDSPALADNDFVTPVNRMKATNGRIFIVLAFTDAVSALYLQMHSILGVKAGLTSLEYVWFVAAQPYDLPTYASFFEDPANRAASFYLGRNVTASDFNPVFGLDGPVSYFPDNPVWLQFNQTWSTYGQRPLNYPLGGGHVVMPMAYDCALSMLYGYDQLLSEYPSSVTLSTIAQRQLDPALTKPSTFSVDKMGSCGMLVYDELGNSQSGGLYILIDIDGKKTIVQTTPLNGNFSAKLEQASFQDGMTLRDVFSIYFNSTDFTIPVDYPPITRANETLTRMAPALAVALCFILAAVVVLGLTWRYTPQTEVVPIEMARLNLVASAIGYGVLFLHIGLPTRLKCVLMTYLTMAAFGVSMSSLWTTTLKLARVAPCRQNGISRRSVMSRPGWPVVASVVMAGWILATIGISLNPPVAVDVPVANLTVYTMCEQSSGWFVELGIYIALMVVLTGWTVRNIMIMAETPILKTHATLFLISLSHLVALTGILGTLMYIPAMLSFIFIFRVVAHLLIPTTVAAPILASVACEIWKKDRAPEYDMIRILESSNIIDMGSCDTIMSTKSIQSLPAAVSICQRGSTLVDVGRSRIWVVESTIIVDPGFGQCSSKKPGLQPFALPPINLRNMISHENTRVTVQFQNHPLVIIDFDDVESAHGLVKAFNRKYVLDSSKGS
ncbi:periplasmic binding protein-like I [Polychytrium aggregatum]|uniref:periplasmic binding protein-like I n=1 Tax=Polychytrium aggregatum TaxID=110093 RepID=UPI0022FF24A1|nr:periplasmic binding protein-like I [Polychytrium aggregatum]KAI9203770.1 periplasmic binding protein-like I [Polychytrium aggregatum]